jgi:CRP/FNR family transcriptional regulator, anaerobic regulatory protein
MTVPHDTFENAVHWIKYFPALSSLDVSLRDLLWKASNVVSFPLGSVIFGPGKTPDAMLLVISGVVRVQQTSEQGREIVLYRIAAGESCVLTTACLFAYEDYSATAIAETGVEAVAIPRTIFDQLIAQSAVFRKFVFTAYSYRLTELFKIVEEIAFGRMDVRLAQKILALAGYAQSVKTTHQQLAAELGTAREVVSRLMHEFQRRGWTDGVRGEIEIVNRDGLEDLAAAH